MLCIKICYLEPELVGAELLKVEPEPKFFTWSRSRKTKYLERKPRKNGSAPQHCLYSNCLAGGCETCLERRLGVVGSLWPLGGTGVDPCLPHPHPELRPRLYTTYVTVLQNRQVAQPVNHSF